MLLEGLGQSRGHLLLPVLTAVPASVGVGFESWSLGKDATLPALPTFSFAVFPVFAFTYRLVFSQATGCS